MDNRELFIERGGMISPNGDITPFESKTQVHDQLAKKIVEEKDMMQEFEGSIYYSETNPNYKDFLVLEKRLCNCRNIRIY